MATPEAQARQALLSRLVEDVLSDWDNHEALLRGLPGYRELIADGTDGQELCRLIQRVALSSLSAVAYRLDEGYDPEAPDDVPGWILLAVSVDGDRLFGPIEGLHEDVPSEPPLR